jgi:hypothetical protein
MAPIPDPFDEVIELELDDDSIDPRPPEDIDDRVMGDRGVWRLQK